jgi:hypothetical protein
VADRPLRPAIHLRLGGPLPHQLANGTWAHLSAAGLTVPAFPVPYGTAYAVLATVSRSYPPPKGRFPCITHPCATKVLLPPFDLHVLGTPPAFVLSQDQTLSSNFFYVVVSLPPHFFYFLTVLLTEPSLAFHENFYILIQNSLWSRTLFLLSSLVKLLSQYFQVIRFFLEPFHLLVNEVATETEFFCQILKKKNFKIKLF